MNIENEPFNEHILIAPNNNLDVMRAMFTFSVPLQHIFSGDSTALFIALFLLFSFHSKVEPFKVIV